MNIKQDLIDMLAIGGAILFLALALLTEISFQTLILLTCGLGLGVGLVALFVRYPELPARAYQAYRELKDKPLLILVSPVSDALALPAPVESALPVPEEAPALPAPEDRKARVIRETFAKFDVQLEFFHVFNGPRLKQYCFKRTRNTKLSQISALRNEISFAISDDSLRIVRASHQGNSYIGIETVRDNPQTVSIDEVLDGAEGLTVALGCDPIGNPVTADLTRMPHALIAGATNSGKSVCVNAIIASLIKRLGPEQLQLLMIDPKIVELMPYNGIPHLVTPVVTDMERVVGALTWALREIERRYKLFSEVGKRNHESYNKWAVEQGKEELPYIVIIIDELADLMMVAPDDVEQIICRIAQKARATGMHLILATQRPSVDVVTGLIKANVPTRISFAVASSVDSRVILDQNGAENLLGRGDMLYQASDSGNLQRLQGCFVSDVELGEIIDYWRAVPIAEPVSNSYHLNPQKAFKQPFWRRTTYEPPAEPGAEPPRTTYEPPAEPPRTTYEPPAESAAEPAAEPLIQVQVKSVEELLQIGQTMGWNEDILIEKLLLFDENISGNRIRDLIGGTKKRIQRKVTQTKERLEIA